MQRRSTQGVVFVHACPKALCQHVEWALERVVGAPVSLSWADQPAAHGSYRAEVAWTGVPGTARQAGRCPPGVADAALRGHRGSQPRQRRRAHVLRARPRRLPGAHQRQRRPRRHRAAAAPPRRHRRRRSRRSGTAWTSCSARPGTPTSRSTATPATAAPSPGCTRSSDEDRGPGSRSARHSGRRRGRRNLRPVVRAPSGKRRPDDLGRSAHAVARPSGRPACAGSSRVNTGGTGWDSRSRPPSASARPRASVSPIPGPRVRPAGAAARRPVLHPRPLVGDVEGECTARVTHP